MDIIDMARASGLTVILDGRIGREEYQSVCGSVTALQRFAESLRPCAAREHDSTPHRPPAASVFGRLRRRISRLARITGAVTKPARPAPRVGHWSLRFRRPGGKATASSK